MEKNVVRHLSFLFLLEIKPNRSAKIEISRGSYGVQKYQYKKFDVVDLFIELVILIGCPLIGWCRPCTELLKFVIDILMEKWNAIKFIKFEKALKKARDIKSDVTNQVLLDHYIENKSFIKKMCVKAKIIGELEVLVKNKHFFEEGDNKHLALRDFILRKIRVREDIYKVNQFKDDDIFLSLAVI